MRTPPSPSVRARVLAAATAGLVLGAQLAALGVPGGGPSPAGALAHDPVLVIGDSLCIGGRDHGGDLTGELHAVGWDPTYLCEVGASMQWGIDAVRTLSHVPATVIVELGTNPGPGAAAFDEQMSAMRHELRAKGADAVLWVDLADAAGRYDEKSSVLRSSASAMGDLVVDWSARVERSSFEPDGIHLTMQGRQQWSRAIAATADMARNRVAVWTVATISGLWAAATA
jgi:hypothetical protein